MKNFQGCNILLTIIKRLNNTQNFFVVYNSYIGTLMENYFNYISKPLSNEDVDLWFKVNNIIFEKLDLFSDFFQSLNELIQITYLGFQKDTNESVILMSKGDNENHFKWCWKKIISNFEKEKINFFLSGEHLEYFYSFFLENFYEQKDKLVREMIGQYLSELFDINKSFTKPDLEMLYSVYKTLDKNLKK